MATIQKRAGKTGTSYLIRVSVGYGSDGKQIIKSKTWRPSAGMTEKQTERELRRVAAEFEQRIENGDTVRGTCGAEVGAYRSETEEHQNCAEQL